MSESIKVKPYGVFRKEYKFGLPTGVTGTRQEVVRSEVGELRQTQVTNHLVWIVKI